MKQRRSILTEVSMFTNSEEKGIIGLKSEF